MVSAVSSQMERGHQEDLVQGQVDRGMPDILLFLWAKYTSQICKLATDTIQNHLPGEIFCRAHPDLLGGVHPDQPQTAGRDKWNWGQRQQQRVRQQELE
ncbi:hypothetical protein Y1Q_0017645 [Alligator mississippiensis]|uniref:Uncharacterized protein n=1 Tax=Alligator mississippiensis TaxID=8496 RepID=A0A151MYY9_ALLMI|nr:hypothetical protein Y1Q_0017645 [Alligator mississippiensis]